MFYYIAKAFKFESDNSKDVESLAVVPFAAGSVLRYLANYIYNTSRLRRINP